MFRGLVQRGVLRSGMGCRTRPNLGSRNIGPCSAGHQFHLGIDVSAPAGTPVRAPFEGRVRKIWRDGELTGYGNVLVLDHPLGLSTLFAHLLGIDVREGQSVRQGDHIARVGATGVNESGPHLHFEVLKGFDARHLHGFSQGESMNITPNPPRANPEAFLSAVSMPLVDWQSL